MVKKRAYARFFGLEAKKTGGVWLPLLSPTVALNKVTDITPRLLKKLNVEAILLDVDNTLAFPGSQKPFPGTVEWSWKLRNDGYRMIIMSNNFRSRVRPFALQYGLPFIATSMKPLPMAFGYAAKFLGSSRERSLVVGDQVFTDILGANLARMKSVLLDPPAQENSISFLIRRCMERSVRRKAQRKRKEK